MLPEDSRASQGGVGDLGLANLGFGNTKGQMHLRLRGRDDWLSGQDWGTNGCIQPGHHQGPSDHMASPAALAHVPTVSWCGCRLRSQDTSTQVLSFQHINEPWRFKGGDYVTLCAYCHALSYSVTLRVIVTSIFVTVYHISCSEQSRVIVTVDRKSVV